MRESKSSQHAVQRFLRGEPVHPGARLRLTEAGETIEQERRRMQPTTGRIKQRKTRKT